MTGDPAAGRLPPNQALMPAGRWPVIGEAEPRPDPAPWSVGVDGLVTGARAWGLSELRDLGWQERRVDIHCVTRWSKLDMAFGGVPLRALLAAAEPLARAQFARFVARSTRNHTSSLPLADLTTLDPLVALTIDGRPLPPDHGGPVRLVVPGRYFYKSVKWLGRVELLAEDRLGFWEAESGYHNTADPWEEQRYIARGLPAHKVRTLLQARDFSGKDLLSLTCDDMDLSGLAARNALLRNASFRRCRLVEADFTGSNLSNACFDHADLRGTRLGDADVEGASFRGADLRGVDLVGTRLFGVSFTAEPHEDAAAVPGAIVDSTTRIGVEQMSALTDPQFRFLKAALAR